MKKISLDVASVSSITFLLGIILIPTIVFCFKINEIGIYIFLTCILVIYILSIILVLNSSYKKVFFGDDYLIIKRKGCIEKKVLYKDVLSFYYDNGVEGLASFTPFTIFLAYYDNGKKVWLEMFASKEKYLEIKNSIDKYK